MSITVKAFGNTDHAVIVWRSTAIIPNCVGFAIFKKKKEESDALATPLSNRIPFQGQQFKPGDQQPSTQWPFQRFLWSDFSVQENDLVQYMVVPMLLVNGSLQKSGADASGWSDPVAIGTGTLYQAYFNRGIISSQFFVRGLTDVSKQVDGGKATVKSVVTGKDSPLRSLLGGPLSAKMFGLLDEVIADKNAEIYAALYELNQQDLIDRLVKLGKRAHIILANGTGKTPGSKSKKANGDENVAARKTLKKAGVDLHDRIVNANQHFAHNKFLVFTDQHAKPQKVWTGSTNWSSNGLFAQVNNGILINDPIHASFFLNEWNELKAAGNEYPDTLLTFNKAAFGDKPRVWFAATKAGADLADANQLINAAQQGVLFLIFNPGPRGTLFNTILDLQNSAKGKNLFIHGVNNQDPGTKGKNLILFHQGTSSAANWSDIIAQNIKENTSFWTKEPKEMVTIHSKVIVVDPFGDKPVVMTGSHNMGPKASGKNDDNLNLIFDADLAKEYATNIMGIYDHYRWRYSVINKASSFKGLVEDPNWMKKYHIDPNETRFFGF